MLGSAIIVFRETLEAALIISIIAVATVGLRHRARWILTGIAAGIGGSMIVAMLTGRISNLADGMGQELFNAAILGMAVLMLAWHNIWMARHGRALMHDARQVGDDVKSGEREMTALTLLIALAVLREGSETVLFLYGMLLGGKDSAASILAGGGAGIVAGIVVGWALYAGIVRIPLRWFFSATSVLVLLLAAAMASNMTRYLVAADWLPSLADPLWDSSAIVSQDSWVGAFLHLLIGYEEQPMGIQVLAYTATAALILLGMWLARVRPPHRAAASSGGRASPAPRAG